MPSSGSGDPSKLSAKGTGVREQSVFSHTRLCSPQQKENTESLSPACRGAHTVAITPDDVISWGCNSDGQTGQGERAEPGWVKPRSLKPLQGLFVTQVVCGRSHTLCVTATSQVSPPPPIPPLPLPLRGLIVMQVVCGRSDTLCVTAISRCPSPPLPHIIRASVAH